MARNVVDTAITMSALQGRDPSDPATANYPANRPRNYAALLRPDALRGARIGLWRLPVLGPDDPGYQATRAELSDLARRSIDEVMASNRLDAIAAPTNPPAWKTDCATGDDDVIPSSTPAAVAGYPDVTVPAGFVGEPRSGCRSWRGGGPTRRCSRSRVRTSGPTERGAPRTPPDTVG